jgi:uncharacterized protein (DUF2267 family)
MHTDQFIGLVQSRARLPSIGEALRAISATFQVLGQRLYGGEAGDLAAQLPSELGHYLLEGQAHGSESFDLDEFFQRVSVLEGSDLPDAIFHARAVISVLQEAVSRGEIDDVRAQLPEEYDPLFESGPEGRMQQAA